MRDVVGKERAGSTARGKRHRDFRASLRAPLPRHLHAMGRWAGNGWERVVVQYWYRGAGALGHTDAPSEAAKVVERLGDALMVLRFPFCIPGRAGTTCCCEQGGTSSVSAAKTLSRRIGHNVPVCLLSTLTSSDKASSSQRPSSVSSLLSSDCVEGRAVLRPTSAATWARLTPRSGSIGSMRRPTASSCTRWLIGMRWGDCEISERAALWLPTVMPVKLRSRCASGSWQGQPSCQPQMQAWTSSDAMHCMHEMLTLGACT